MPLGFSKQPPRPESRFGASGQNQGNATGEGLLIPLRRVNPINRLARIEISETSGKEIHIQLCVFGCNLSGRV
jgi:hypothetical protein